MQWNDLDYETQQLVISRFGDMLLAEQDEQLQFAMASALVELEMWSNSPVIERSRDPVAITVEADPFREKDSK